MKVFVRITAALLFLSNPAHACDIEDCALPSTLHQINGETAPAHGVWTWLHHDLALARESAHRGSDARALTMAHSLDRILRLRVNDLIGFSDTQAVIDFHLALQTVIRSAGGWPLAEIDTEGKGVQG